MSEKIIKSVWSADLVGRKYPQLNEDISIDVVIIGGGIAGIMAAYFLMDEGHTVAIIEASQIASGTSGNTTAKITSLHDLKYSFLKKSVGIEKAKIYADSNQWAIEVIKNIIEKEKINCDFEMLPAYVFAKTDDGFREIEKELEVASSLGLPASILTEDSEISFPIKGEIKFENQACFHPKKYLLAIAEILSNRGILIFENSRVKDVVDGDICIIKTDKNIVTAKKVIIATNYPIYDKGLFYLRMNQMRSYAIAAQLNSPIISGMYIGNDEEKLTFRPHISSEGEWMIIGGEDSVTGDLKENNSPFENLENLAKKYFDIRSIDYRWAAQDSMPIDNFPCIGKMPRTKNIYVTTGFGEWGMTTSIVSAKILSDLINEKDNVWESLYAPSRFKIAAAIKGAPSQISHVAKGFGSKAIKAEELDVSKLSICHGRIMQHGEEKVAVYKDETGGVHPLSAKCTHMGCMVNWNKAEKSWDCPCHGSRFDTDGQVLNSPAVKPLPKIKK